MIRTIIIVTLNDLAIAFKNKTIYLILFVPLFIFVSLHFVDQKDSAVQPLTIGLIQHEPYPPMLVQSIKAADAVFALSWVSHAEEGTRQIKEKKLDGMLITSGKGPRRVELVVVSKASARTLALVEGLSALQQAAEGGGKNWISAVRSLQDSGLHKLTLPTWVLLLVLLVGFIVIPAQVAEEKEKKLLLGLLQTPMRELEWLLAKVLSGMILMHLSVLFLHLLGRSGFGHRPSYVAFLGAGSFCFSAFGMVLGFLCRSQASARTLGFLFYLPLLLPAALSDVSRKLNNLAPLMPSYQFYGPVRSILLEGGRISNFPLEWTYLLCIGLVACSFAYVLMKVRWLM